MGLQSKSLSSTSMRNQKAVERKESKKKYRPGLHVKKSTDDPRNRATRRSDERFDRLNPERLRKQKISIQRKDSKEEGRKIQLEKLNQKQNDNTHRSKK